MGFSSENRYAKLALISNIALFVILMANVLDARKATTQKMENAKSVEIIAKNAQLTDAQHARQLTM